ncbi:MAG: hypothetical protein A2426_09770 [Candidatus Lambdaproteobacteria bacterium RIFOXYC1_FULL_56_13]|nr:MAG: hypothetical protein A2426_09770 [Candidatus Lambdaproteobacteria bacterium RIFOXYC1_FULL_56_13]
MFLLGWGWVANRVWRHPWLVYRIWAGLAWFGLLHCSFVQGQKTLGFDALSFPLQAAKFQQQMAQWGPMGVIDHWADWDPFTALGSSITQLAATDFTVLLWTNWALGSWLSPAEVVNLMTLNQVVAFSLGMGLAVWTLKPCGRSALFGFLVALLSDLLPHSMVQPFAWRLYPFPFLLVFLLRWLRRGKPSDLLLAATFGGYAFTIYLPSEPAYGLLFFLVPGVWLGIKGLSWKNLKLRLRQQWGWVAWAGLVFALIASVNLYRAMGLDRMVHTNRGARQGIQAQVLVPGQHPSVTGHAGKLTDLNALWSNQPLSTPNHAWAYLGALAVPFGLLALGFGFRLPVVRVILVALVLLFLTLLGREGPWFEVLNQIPGLNYLRHYLFVLNFFTLYTLVLAALGFGLWHRQKGSLWLRLLWLEWAGVTGWLALQGPPETSFWLNPQGQMALLALVLAFWPPKRGWGRGELWVLLGLALSLGLTQKEKLAVLAQPFAAVAGPVAAYPSTRPCVVPVGKDLGWAAREGVACVSFPQANLVNYPAPTLKLLNLLYPERNDPRLLTQVRPEIYDHKEPLLGNGFPIFFLVFGAQWIPQSCWTEDPCLDATLLAMARQYREMRAQAYFFAEDLSPKVAASSDLAPVAVFPDPQASSTNKVVLNFNAPGPGYLVRLESFDPLWSARLNGEEVPTYRANYAFSALEVPSGPVQVVWRYQNYLPWLQWLHQLPLGVAVAFLWAGALVRRKNR